MARAAFGEQQQPLTEAPAGMQPIPGSMGSGLGNWNGNVATSLSCSHHIMFSQSCIACGLPAPCCSQRKRSRAAALRSTLLLALTLLSIMLGSVAAHEQQGQHQRALSLVLSDFGPRLIAAGNDVTCAIVGEEVRCWGKDPDGFITGNANDQSDDYDYGAREYNDFTCSEDLHQSGTNIAFDPPGATDPEVPAEIGMLAFVACVRFQSGGVRCWGVAFSAAFFGAGNSSALMPASGLPSRGNVAFEPGAGDGPTLAAALSAGDVHSCMVSTTSEVYCWGRGLLGKLGSGSSADIGDAATPTIPRVPLPSGVAAVQVVAGQSATCVLSTAAQVYCWGQQGYHGYADAQDLGDDPNEVSTRPALPLASSTAGATVTHLWGGRVMCAAFSDAKATCWGSNNVGLHGINANTDVPVVQPGANFVQLPLAAGDTLLPSFVEPVVTNCARIAPADPAVAPYMRCWGNGRRGLLAQDTSGGNFGSSSTAPGRVEDAAPLDFGALPAGFAPRQLTSQVHACALLTAVPPTDPGFSAANHMMVRCWGPNWGCRLGITGISNLDFVGDGSGLTLATVPNAIEPPPSTTSSATPTSTPSPSYTPSVSVTPTFLPSTSPSTSQPPVQLIATPPSSAAGTVSDGGGLSPGPAVAVALVAVVVVGATANVVLQQRRRAGRARARRSARPVPPPPAAEAV